MFRRTLIISLIVTISLILFFAITSKKKSHVIPVLIYHDISQFETDSNSYSVSTSTLERELSYLKENQYRTVSFQEAFDAYKNHAPMQRMVILAFDDASKSHMQFVLPLLQKYAFKATFFIPSGWIGEKNKLSWDDVRALSNAGMEIGGHSISHAHLTYLSPSQQKKEIDEDKAAIEKNIQKKINAFAYPFGESDNQIETIVREAGYSIARTSNPSPISGKGDLITFGGIVMQNNFDSFLTIL